VDENGGMSPEIERPKWFRQVQERKIFLGILKYGQPMLFEVFAEPGPVVTVGLDDLRPTLGVSRDAERDFQEADMLASRAFTEGRFDDWVQWPYGGVVTGTPPFD